jgi:hypothetical protein
MYKDVCDMHRVQVCLLSWLWAELNKIVNVIFLH